MVLDKKGVDFYLLIKLVLWTVNCDRGMENLRIGWRGVFNFRSLGFPPLFSSKEKSDSQNK
jgi:hypothetical protein